MGFGIVKIFLTSGDLQRSHRSRSSPENFEIEYLENGTR